MPASDTTFSSQSSDLLTMREKPVTLAEKYRSFRDFGKRAHRLAAPYWKSEESKKRAWTLLIIVVLLEVGDAFLIGRLSFATADMLDVFSNRQFERTTEVMGTWIAVSAVIVVSAILQIYFHNHLLIGWREFMTNRFLSQYLTKGLYHQMELTDYQVDNPDQRISMDTHEVIERTLQLSLQILTMVSRMGVFGVILWQVSGALEFDLASFHIYIPGYMFWAATIYGLFTVWAAHKAGKRLIPLNVERQRREADFRYKLIRLRENTEGIALLDGDETEKKDLRAKFVYIRENWLQLLKYKLYLTSVTRTLSEASIVVPYVVALPALIAGTVAVGSYLQLTQAFARVEIAMSFIANAYDRIAEWKAGADRLLRLEDGIALAEYDKRQSKIIRAVGTNSDLEINDVTLKLPTGVELIKNESFTLKAGEDVVVTGQSGSGKSTLFRALSGHWYWGSGNIVHPNGKILFLPQKPYLPLATLREALVYPSPPETVSDNELKSFMRYCQLDKFVERLDELDDWSHVLSGGEQQRLSIVRAFVAKPNWLFMDESTSAMDHATESKIYEAIKKELPKTTIVSIAHRERLKRFHDIEIRIEPATKSLSVKPVPEAY